MAEKVYKNRVKEKYEKEEQKWKNKNTKQVTNITEENKYGK